MVSSTQSEVGYLEMISCTSDSQVEDTLRGLVEGCSGIEKNYLLAGTLVGRMLSFAAYGGQPSRRMLKQLVAAERAYVLSGYEPLTIDDFVRLGGWGTSPGDRFKKAAAVRPAMLPAAQYCEELKLEEEKEPTVFDRLRAFLQRWYK